LDCNNGQKQGKYIVDHALAWVFCDMLLGALMMWVLYTAHPFLSQEVCVVLLDVGSQMGDLLEPAAKTVSEFIQGKVRPGHMASQLLSFSSQEHPNSAAVMACSSSSSSIAVWRNLIFCVSPACVHDKAQSLLHAALVCLQMINKPAHEVQLVFFGTTGAERSACASAKDACVNVNSIL
jgi:hypothetical protein